jgi:hypothetical protein
MKQIIPFLLLTLFLVSCSSQTPVTTPTTPTSTAPVVIDTDKIAEDFVKAIPEYSDYNGGNLNMIRKVDSGFEKIDYVFRFGVNTPKLASSVKFIEVRLMMQGSEVTHNMAVEVEQADLKTGALTQVQCESKGGRLANNIAGALCNDGESNAGDLEGFIIPYVCCV